MSFILQNQKKILLILYNIQLIIYIISIFNYEGPNTVPCWMSFIMQTVMLFNAFSIRQSILVQKY